MSQNGRRVIGATLSALSGCCYGTQFTFTTLIQNHAVIDGQRASQNGLDYVFGHYCGIFFASTIIFLGYVLIKGRNSMINTKIIIPSTVAGLIWGTANAGFFIANATLSQAIAYPIVACVPGMLGALLGVSFFREIKGTRNYLILTAACVLTIGGTIFNGLSF